MAPHAINFMTGTSATPPSIPPLEPTVDQTSSKRRPALFLVLGLICLIFILGFLWYQHVNNSGTAIRSQVTLEPKKPQNILKKISFLAFNTDDAGAKLAGAAEDRINVLLLGMGGAGHDGPYLTDTIMIASIKPSTKELALISIPRDLGVYIPGYGQQKINHVNAYGEVKQPNWGAAATTELISKTFNLDIPYYIRLDFKAFEEIIDELDGVTVTIDTAFTDQMFPAPNFEYQTVSFKAGEQTLKGEKALMFARSRHGNNGEGSDFARARRQQKILAALKDKVTDIGVIANPVTITNILNDLETHVTTNMEFDELVSLARLGKNLDTAHIKSLVLDSSPNGFLMNYFSDGGAYMLAPKTGNFSAISQAMASVFSTSSTNLATATTPNKPVETTTLTPKKPDSSSLDIEIQNGTWNAGLAARVKRRLEFRDLEVATISNAAEKPINQSKIYATKSAPKSLIDTLQDELKIPATYSIPTTIQLGTTTDVLIILGDDFID